MKIIGMVSVKHSLMHVHDVAVHYELSYMQ